MPIHPLRTHIRLRLSDRAAVNPSIRGLDALFSSSGLFSVLFYALEIDFYALHQVVFLVLLLLIGFGRRRQERVVRLFTL